MLDSHNQGPSVQREAFRQGVSSTQTLLETASEKKKIIKKERKKKKQRGKVEGKEWGKTQFWEGIYSILKITEAMAHIRGRTGSGKN